MMVMGMMSPRAKKSYLDKGPTKEQLERRKLIKGRLLFEDADEDIDFTKSQKKSTKRGLSPFRGAPFRGGKIKAGRRVSPKRTMRRQSRIMAGRSVSPERNKKKPKHVD
jgi:hypothetical protein